MAFSDFFKVNDYKQQIKKLENENNLLKNRNDYNLNISQMDAMHVEASIHEKELDLKKLSDEIEKNSVEKNKLNEEIETLISKREDIRADISDLSPSLEMSSYGLYEPQYDFATALEYKDRLSDIRNLQKEMIKDKIAVTYNANWRVDDSLALGKKMNRNNIKAILRSFNNECTEAISKVTYSNIDRIQNRIIRSFEQHNKMYEVVSIGIVSDYLDLKIDELFLAFEYKQKVQDEKEILREEREREREEKALKKDIEREKKKLDKEINHYSKAVSELEHKLTLDENNAELQMEIEKLKNELDDYKQQKNDVDYRESNATAGYVYIISNIGSFGNNVVKIGVTRRLDPTERVNELGSASVPFKFDIHALIFSENAYKLESQLHKKFEHRRVNKVNSRKEYFNISIEEIEEELKKYKNVTVDFNEIPEAEEYRASAKIGSTV